MVEQSEVTVIGETILVTGSLRGDENLTVLGRVEGQVNLSQTLLVAEGGIVKAEVAVHNAVVSGIVVGNVTAADCVHITATGKVLGDVRGKRVILDTGGRINGAIEAGSAKRAEDRSSQRNAQSLQNHNVSVVPTSLMARRQLSQQAARSNLHGVSDSPQESDPHQRAAQEAMAMAVKKKVAGKKRG